MRNYRASKGPFRERPYFKDEEIEEICTAELKKADLLPASPEPIRIERFIEKRFGITPEYDDLPNGVLGFTRFSTKGVAGIVVSRALADERTTTSERRINATLAHETGHGLLHAHLFGANAEPARLFGSDYDPASPRILCRDEVVNSTGRGGYDGRWWEFQANRTIGALLLPRRLVEQCLAATMLESRGSFGVKQLPPEKREQAVAALVSTFDINPAAARIRVDQVFPLRDSAQLTF